MHRTNLSLWVRRKYIPSDGKSSYVNHLVKRLAGGTGGQKELM